MITNIIAISSLAIALTALCLTLWQNVLQIRADRAQVFLQMINQYNSDTIYRGVISLYNLQKYDDFETFLTQEKDPNVQISLVKLVDFLIDAARLVFSGYLPRQRVWDLYFMEYRTAYEKLSPWWIDAQRRQTINQRFVAFEEMCLQIMEISPEVSRDYDIKHYPRYARKYHSQATAK